MSNLGFQYSMFYMLCIMVIFTFVPLLLHKNIIQNQLSRIVYFDGEFYEPENMTAKEYFDRETPITTEIELKEVLVKHNKEESPLGKEIQNPKSDRTGETFMSRFSKDLLIDDDKILDTQSIKLSEMSKFEGDNLNFYDKDVPLDRSIVLSPHSIHLSHFDNPDYSRDLFTLKLKSKYGDSMNDENFVSSVIKFDSLKKKKKFSNNIVPKDYEKLESWDIIRYDRRGFFRFLWDSLLQEHPAINLAFRKSLLEPIFLRIVSIVTLINLTFAFNAIFFTDDYIEKRADSSEEERKSFFFTFYQECVKQIISLAMGTTIESILGLIITFPSSYEEDLMKAIKAKDKALIIQE
jgi:hypothetical protein